MYKTLNKVHVPTLQPTHWTCSYKQCHSQHSEQCVCAYGIDTYAYVHRQGSFNLHQKITILKIINAINLTKNKQKKQKQVKLAIVVLIDLCTL